MDKAFDRITFEFQNEVQYMVRSFLIQFDAIFTLNQDLLMERFYLLRGGRSVAGPGRIYPACGPLLPSRRVP